MPADPEIDYLEKLFGDAYRREVDEQENVWRSLPFFAATLALQLAGLAEIRDWVASVDGWLFRVSVGLLGLAATFTLAALVFLAQSIWPVDFRFVTNEAGLRQYIDTVRTSAVARGAAPLDAAEEAVWAARTILVAQYAENAVSNRAINRRRISRHTRAGPATLASVFAVLVLVGLVVVSNVHGNGRPGSDHAGLPAAGALLARPAPDQPGAAAADGGGAHRVVELHDHLSPTVRPAAGRP